MRTLKILSTKILSPELIRQTAGYMDISEIEMIKINPIQTSEKHKEIEQWLNKKLPLIFTSSNAVEIILQVVKEKKIVLGSPTIYSISGRTYDRLKQHFPNTSIIKGKDASELAAGILNDHVKEIVFYCADIRRNELPDTLQKSNTLVHEVIVYNTIENPSKIEGSWDGILFYSPSGVRSFFKANQLSGNSVCFAIGETTANEIAQYTKNKIVKSQIPDPANMINEAAAFFKTLSENGIKE